MHQTRRSPRAGAGSKGYHPTIRSPINRPQSPSRGPARPAPRLVLRRAIGSDDVFAVAARDRRRPRLSPDPLPCAFGRRTSASRLRPRTPLPAAGGSSQWWVGGGRASEPRLERSTRSIVHHNDGSMCGDQAARIRLSTFHLRVGEYDPYPVPSCSRSYRVFSHRQVPKCEALQIQRSDVR